MALVVPNVTKEAYLDDILGDNLILKLYSNNVTPVVTNVAADFTEVVGGGYASKTLLSVDWSTTLANPSVATQGAQNFTFTGATSAPGTIYGYFVVTSSGVLRWAERFAAGVVPFTPIVGSLIRINPRIALA